MFLEFLEIKEKCSCGQYLDSCTFWGPVTNEILLPGQRLTKTIKYSENQERHRNIFKLLLRRKPNSEYLTIQHGIFKAIAKHAGKPYILDSSKFLARYLLLSQSHTLPIKGIYVVRDVRGVIYSFSKKVQTPRTSMSSIIYYLLINFFGEIMYRRDKNIIKVRYEDLMEDLSGELTRIYKHIFGTSNNISEPKDHYEMPHIIGGNRMKTQKEVIIATDIRWKEALPRWKQIASYLATLPLMIINRYKI
jgi:hypothetical protein